MGKKKGSPDCGSDRRSPNIETTMLALRRPIGNVGRNFNQELRLRAPRVYGYRHGSSFAQLRMVLQLLNTFRRPVEASLSLCGTRLGVETGISGGEYYHINLRWLNGTRWSLAEI
jgi:hypothetical protein